VNTAQDIQDFLAQKTLAVAGASRNPQSFSANVARDLKAKGYTLYPVNPNAKEVGGEICYPAVAAIPVKVGGVIFFTPPAATEKAVKEAAAAGVTRMWIQQGAQSKEALAFCAEKGINAVSGQCILMFAEPVGSFHGFHRWMKKLFGGLPK
jgi:uncharacterized protein